MWVIQFESIELLQWLQWTKQNLHIVTITHTIHVWYIYLHLVDFYGKCRYIDHTWILWVRSVSINRCFLVLLSSGYLPPCCRLRALMLQRQKYLRLNISHVQTELRFLFYLYFFPPKSSLPHEIYMKFSVKKPNLFFGQLSWIPFNLEKHPFCSWNFFTKNTPSVQLVLLVGSGNGCSRWGWIPPQWRGVESAANHTKKSGKNAEIYGVFPKMVVPPNHPF